MSGVWNTATLDITLPSNVAPTTGSGALYLGGPQLPAELKNAGYTSAIVWFSDGNAFLKYWFMARYGDLAVDSWTFGYCTVAPGPTLGTLVNMDAINAFSFPTNDVQRDITKIHGLVGSGAFVRLSKDGPIIKADYALTGMDGWISTTRTRTIGGVANCTVNVDWRITIDYIIDVRIYITCPSAPGVGSGVVNVALSTTMPQPDYSPSVGFRGPYGTLLGAGGTGQANYVTRIDTGWNMVIFVNGNAPGNTSFEGSMTFTVPK